MVADRGDLDTTDDVTVRQAQPRESGHRFELPFKSHSVAGQQPGELLRSSPVRVDFDVLAAHFHRGSLARSERRRVGEQGHNLGDRSSLCRCHAHPRLR